MCSLVTCPHALSVAVTSTGGRANQTFCATPPPAVLTSARALSRRYLRHQPLLLRIIVPRALLTAILESAPRNSRYGLELNSTSGHPAGRGDDQHRRLDLRPPDLHRRTDRTSPPSVLAFSRLRTDAVQSPAPSFPATPFLASRSALENDTDTDTDTVTTPPRDSQITLVRFLTAGLCCGF